MANNNNGGIVRDELAKLAGQASEYKNEVKEAKDELIELKHEIKGLTSEKISDKINIKINSNADEVNDELEKLKGNVANLERAMKVFSKNSTNALGKVVQEWNNLIKKNPDKTLNDLISTENEDSLKVYRQAVAYMASVGSKEMGTSGIEAQSKQLASFVEQMGNLANIPEAITYNFQNLKNVFEGVGRLVQNGWIEALDNINFDAIPIAAKIEDKSIEKIAEKIKETGDLGKETGKKAGEEIGIGIEEGIKKGIDNINLEQILEAKINNALEAVKRKVRKNKIDINSINDFNEIAPDVISMYYGYDLDDIRDARKTVLEYLDSEGEYAKEYEDSYRHSVKNNSQYDMENYLKIYENHINNIQKAKSMLDYLDQIYNETLSEMSISDSWDEDNIKLLIASIESLKNAFDALSRSMNLSDENSSLSAVFTTLQTSISDTELKLNDLKSLLSVSIDGSDTNIESIASIVHNLSESLSELFNTADDGNGPFKQLLDSISKIEKALQTDTLQKAIEDIAKVSESMNKFYTDIQGNSSQGVNQAFTELKTSIDKIEKLIPQAFDTNVIETFKTELIRAVGEIKEAIGSIDNGMNLDFGSIGPETSAWSKQYKRYLTFYDEIVDRFKKLYGGDGFTSAIGKLTNGSTDTTQLEKLFGRESIQALSQTGTQGYQDAVIQVMNFARDIRSALTKSQQDSLETIESIRNAPISKDLSAEQIEKIMRDREDRIQGILKDASGMKSISNYIRDSAYALTIDTVQSQVEEDITSSRQNLTEAEKAQQEFIKSLFGGKQIEDAINTMEEKINDFRDILKKGLGIPEDTQQQTETFFSRLTTSIETITTAINDLSDSFAKIAAITTIEKTDLVGIHPGQLNAINDAFKQLHKTLIKIHALLKATFNVDPKKLESTVATLESQAEKEASRKPRSSKKTQTGVQQAGEAVIEAVNQKQPTTPQAPTPDVSSEQAFLERMKASTEKIFKAGYEIGRNLDAGTSKGVSENQEAIAKVEEKTDQMVETVKKKLGIESPSRVFMQIGKYCVEGMIIGLKDSQDQLSNVITDVFSIQNYLKNADESQTKDIENILVDSLKASFADANPDELRLAANQFINNAIGGMNLADSLSDFGRLLPESIANQVKSQSLNSDIFASLGIDSKVYDVAINEAQSVMENLRNFEADIPSYSIKGKNSIVAQIDLIIPSLQAYQGALKDVSEAQLEFSEVTSKIDYLQNARFNLINYGQITTPIATPEQAEQNAQAAQLKQIKDSLQGIDQMFPEGKKEYQFTFTDGDTISDIQTKIDNIFGTTETPTSKPINVNLNNAETLKTQVQDALKNITIAIQGLDETAKTVHDGIEQGIGKISVSASLNNSSISDIDSDLESVGPISVTGSVSDAAIANIRTDLQKVNPVPIEVKLSDNTIENLQGDLSKISGYISNNVNSEMQTLSQGITQQASEAFSAIKESSAQPGGEATQDVFDTAIQSQIDKLKGLYDFIVKSIPEAFAAEKKYVENVVNSEVATLDKLRAKLTEIAVKITEITDKLQSKKLTTAEFDLITSNIPSKASEIKGLLETGLKGIQISDVQLADGVVQKIEEELASVKIPSLDLSPTPSDTEAVASGEQAKPLIAKQVEGEIQELQKLADFINNIVILAIDKKTDMFLAEKKVVEKAVASEVGHLSELNTKVREVAESVKVLIGRLESEKIKGEHKILFDSNIDDLVKDVTEKINGIKEQAKINVIFSDTNNTLESFKTQIAQLQESVQNPLGDSMNKQGAEIDKVTDKLTKLLELYKQSGDVNVLKSGLDTKDFTIPELKDIANTNNIAYKSSDKKSVLAEKVANGLADATPVTDMSQLAQINRQISDLIVQVGKLDQSIGALWNNYGTGDGIKKLQSDVKDVKQLITDIGTTLPNAVNTKVGQVTTAQSAAFTALNTTLSGISDKIKDFNKDITIDIKPQFDEPKLENIKTILNNFRANLSLDKSIIPGFDQTEFQNKIDEFKRLSDELNKSKSLYNPKRDFSTIFMTMPDNDTSTSYLKQMIDLVNSLTDAEFKALGVKPDKNGGFTEYLKIVNDSYTELQTKYQAVQDLIGKGATPNSGKDVFNVDLDFNKQLGSVVRETSGLFDLLNSKFDEFKSNPATSAMDITISEYGRLQEKLKDISDEVDGLYERLSSPSTTTFFDNNVTQQIYQLSADLKRINEELTKLDTSVTSVPKFDDDTITKIGEFGKKAGSAASSLTRLNNALNTQRTPISFDSDIQTIDGIIQKLTVDVPQAFQGFDQQIGGASTLIAGRISQLSQLMSGVVANLSALKTALGQFSNGNILRGELDAFDLLITKIQVETVEAIKAKTDEFSIEEEVVRAVVQSEIDELLLLKGYIDKITTSLGRIGTTKSVTIDATIDPKTFNQIKADIDALGQGLALAEYDAFKSKIEALERGIQGMVQMMSAKATRTGMFTNELSTLEQLNIELDKVKTKLSNMNWHREITFSTDIDSVMKDVIDSITQALADIQAKIQEVAPINVPLDIPLIPKDKIDGIVGQLHQVQQAIADTLPFQELRDSTAILDEVRQKYEKFLELFKQDNNKDAFIKSLKDNFLNTELTQIGAYERVGFPPSAKNRSKQTNAELIAERAETNLRIEPIIGDVPIGRQSLAKEAQEASVAYERLASIAKDALAKLGEVRTQISNLLSSYTGDADTNAGYFSGLITALTETVPNAITDKNTAFDKEEEHLRKDVIPKEKEDLKDLSKSIEDVITSIDFKTIGLDQLDSISTVFDSLDRILTNSSLDQLRQTLAAIVSELSALGSVNIGNSNILTSLDSILNRTNELTTLAEVLAHSRQEIERARQAAERVAQNNPPTQSTGNGGGRTQNNNLPVPSNGNGSGTPPNITNVAQNAINAINNAVNQNQQNASDAVQNVNQQAEQAINIIATNTANQALSLNDIIEEFNEREREAIRGRIQNDLGDIVRIISTREDVPGSDYLTTLAGATLVGTRGTGRISAIRDAEGNKTGMQYEGVFTSREYDPAHDVKWITYSHAIDEYERKLRDAGELTDDYQTKIEALRNLLGRLDYPNADFSTFLALEKEFVQTVKNAKNATDQHNQAFQANIKLIKDAMRETSAYNDIVAKNIKDGQRTDLQSVAEAKERRDQALSRAGNAMGNIYRQRRAGHIDDEQLDVATTLMNEARAGDSSSRQNIRTAIAEQLTKSLERLENVYTKLNNLRAEDIRNGNKNVNTTNRRTEALNEEVNAINNLITAQQQARDFRNEGLIIQEDYDAFDTRASQLLNFDISDVTKGSSESQDAINKAVNSQVDVVDKAVVRYEKAVKRVQNYQEMFSNGERVSGRLRASIIAMNDAQQVASNLLKVLQDINNVNPVDGDVLSNLETRLGKFNDERNTALKGPVATPGFKDPINGYQTLSNAANNYYKIQQKIFSGLSTSLNERTFFNQIKDYFEAATTSADEFLKKLGHTQDYINNLDPTAKAEYKTKRETFLNTNREAMKGVVEATLDNLESDMSRLQNLSGVKPKGFTADIERLRTLLDTGIGAEIRGKTTSDWGSFSFDQFEKYIKDLARLRRELDIVEKGPGSENVNKLQSSKLSRQMAEWATNNGAAVQAKRRIEELQQALVDIDDQGSLNEVAAEFERIRREANETGKVGYSFAQKLKQSFSNLARYLASFASFYRIMGAIRSSIQTVTELDTSMTNLKKVVDATDQAFANFRKSSFRIAGEVGSTAKAVTDAAVEWGRLGYSIKEVEELARSSVIYSNVGDIDVTTASQDLVSALKAFDMEADQALHVTDILNEIGM